MPTGGIPVQLQMLALQRLPSATPGGPRLVGRANLPLNACKTRRNRAGFLACRAVRISAQQLAHKAVDVFAAEILVAGELDHMVRPASALVMGQQRHAGPQAVPSKDRHAAMPKLGVAGVGLVDP